MDGRKSLDYFVSLRQTISPMEEKYSEGMLLRAHLLMGSEVMTQLAEKRVILFGVGGVGSWCAECLVRTGIRHLTIVDSDRVCISNCNRQLMATSRTVNQIKVEALRDRLLEINPDAVVTCLQIRYNEDTSASFHLEEFDYVIDAIDSVRDKAHLILTVTAIKQGPKLFSSMGAALRLDPLKVTRAEFWNVKGDALARALRDRFKRNKTFPARKFQCVYSEEQPLSNKGEASGDAGQEHPNGSLAQVTAVFGFALASMVTNDVYKQSL